MPRAREQLPIPGTAPPPGPCDDQRDRLVKATEDAVEATAEKKRARDALLDRMQETGVSRVAIVDANGRRKWLEITADPKLRTVSAEPVDGEEDAGGGSAASRAADLTRVARAAVSTAAGPDLSAQPADGDPFASTRENMQPGILDDAADAQADETPAQRSARESEEGRAARRAAGKPKRGGKGK